MVSVSGSGFPDSSLAGSSGSVVVSLQGGAPCDVTFSNFSLVQCTTRARSGSGSGSAPASDLPLKGLYPGMRGVELTVFPS